MSETVEFGQLFSVPLRNGVSYASKLRGTGVPMINMKEIFAHDRIGKVKCELAPITEDQRKKYLLEDFDLLFARQSLTYDGAGKCSLVLPVEEDRTWESHLIRVRLDPKVSSPEYYYYYFRSPQGRRNIESIVQQVAAAGIRGSDLARLRIPNPPLAQQRAMAEVLGALDDKIAANSRLAETLAEMATAQFDLRAKTATVSVPLSELVTTQYGVTTSSHEGPGPQFLRVTDINKKPWIEWATTPYCTVSETELEKYKVTAGDILVARMADPGKAAFVDLGDPEAVFASYLVRLRALNTDQALFIYYFLRSTTYRNYAEGAMQGSVQKNMNAKVIVATDIAMPKIGVLRDFNEVAAKLRTQIQGVLKENLKLMAVRDALLPRFMSGKLRIKKVEELITASI